MSSMNWQRKLKEMEAQHPEFITETSFTQHVGGTASSRFEKVEHAVKMESLQDVFSLEEVREFVRAGCAMKEFGRSM